ALTVKPTVYVSHIRQFWSTARIKTTKEGTQILATVDGIQRTVSKSSLMRNLKLQDEERISSLPDTELFENLTLIGYNVSPNQKFTFQKGQFSHQWKRTKIAQSSVLPTVADEPASPLRDVSQGEAYPTDSNVSQGEAYPTDSGFIADQDRETIDNGSIPTASTPAEEKAPTGSDVVPTASLVFATAIVVTPYRRRKGKEVMVESETLKKQKVQEQIDAQVTRELEEQLEREDQRRNNETVAKYLQEYHLFALELPIERRIELITDLVKYQDNYANIYKYQSQQRKPMTNKQKKDYYMAVIRNNLGWKVKDFRVEWKLYDTCGVHHVTSKDKEIFMLVEKDYPLRKGLALVMICYKLQVENYSQMANDLNLKIYKIAKSPRQRGD
nr:hypothetical protein [Tanacetum cinerariifolium]